MKSIVYPYHCKINGNDVISEIHRGPTNVKFFHVVRAYHKLIHLSELPICRQNSKYLRVI